MLLFLSAIYAIIVGSWDGFWIEYAPDDYETEVQSWGKSH